MTKVIILDVYFIFYSECVLKCCDRHKKYAYRISGILTFRLDTSDYMFVYFRIAFELRKAWPHEAKNEKLEF